MTKFVAEQLTRLLLLEVGKQLREITETSDEMIDRA